jgi:hypothetical protein
MKADGLLDCFKYARNIETTVTVYFYIDEWHGGYKQKGYDIPQTVADKIKAGGWEE